MNRFNRRSAALIASLVFLSGCENGTDPDDSDVALEFSDAVVQLGYARAGSVVLRNVGDEPVTLDIVADPVRRAGIEVPGVAVEVVPAVVSALAPGDSIELDLAVSGAEGLQPGTYSALVRVRVDGHDAASTTLTFEVDLPAGLVGSVDIVGLPDSMRRGDIVQLAAVVRDTLGAVIDSANVGWTTTPVGAGQITADEEFVAYAAGPLRFIATAGGVADTADVVVTQRVAPGSFSVVGHTSLTSRWTSDLWAYLDVAYTGTWNFRERPGNTMYVWDITGATPIAIDSIQVAAGTTGDVMIRADGRLAVIPHEQVSGPNPVAITLVDMTDRRHPTIAGQYHSDISSGFGIHNAWLDGDYAYIVVDGVGSDRGLWIIDVSDPVNPVRVARFYAGSSNLHDVIVRDGLAFLSHWDAGLIILDVGNGVRGGTPTNPVEVSRILTPGGQVHNAWYWPETGYVFIGEEDYSTPGRVHVVDASDLENPEVVAFFRVSGDSPHNFWLDEEREILYTSWYSQGVQAVDVSGRLLGSLDLQGRMIASLIYDGAGACPGSSGTCAWGPQLHDDGYLYVADMNTGLWKLQPNF